MSRAIDVEKAVEIIESRQKKLCPVGRYGRNYVYGSDREKYDAWDEIIDALENLPTLTPQNEPLIIEELLDMNNIPLWVVDTTINRSEWCYWKNGLAYSCEDYPEYYDPDDYGVWLAYRRLPERQEDT